MGMVGNFRMSSDSEVQKLLEEPEEIEVLLYSEASEQSDDTSKIDVDKAWHGIHFLLCGDPIEGNPPLNFILSGGMEVGDIDVGYGPARVYTSAEVAEIAQALEPVTPDQFRSRFDAESLIENEIYPEIWYEPIEECFDGYVLPHFEKLKVFILKARDEKRALIVYLN